MSIEHKVKKVLSDYFKKSESDFQLETNLTEDIGADSLDAVEVVLILEDIFDIEIDDDELQTLATVKDIVSLVESRA